MKRIYAFAFLFATSLAAVAQFNKMPELVSGNAQFIMDDALIYHEWDYANCVEYDFDKKNNKFVDPRGGLLDPVRLGNDYDRIVKEWENATQNANNALIKQFNKYQKKNKFAAQMTSNRDEAKYIMTTRIDTLYEFGGGSAVAAVMAPIIAMTTAYDAASGAIIVKEKETNKVICELKYNSTYNKTGGRGIMWARLWGLHVAMIHNCFEGLDLFSGAIKKGPKAPNYPYLYPNEK